MRPKADILAEVREAAAGGRKEVQLLGQIVNHYEAPDDASCDFTGLLEAVHEIEGIDRIRFASPHPRHVDDRFLEAMRRLPKVCRHLHLPVQSGSTAVLGAMRRRYTRETYLALVERIRERLPEVQARVRARLDERLAELGASVERERIEQELALLLQRLDVDEELERLSGHIEEVRRVIGASEPAGRRLDFLMQELNREANTLSSKSQDLETTRTAVDMKVIIEQMREQVQNAE